MWKHLRQLTKESVIYGFSGVMSALVSMILVPLYAKTFSKSEYGVIDLVISTMNLLTIVAVLGLDNSAHRWYWQHDDEAERSRTVATWAWTNIVTNSLLGVVVFVFAPQVAVLVGSAPANADYFRLGALTLPLGALTIVTSGWLRMRRQPVMAVTYTAISSLVIVALSLLFVLVMHKGLYGVMWAFVAGDIAVSIMGLALLSRVLNPRLFDVSRLREMLRFSLPLLPAGLAGWAIAGAGRFFISHDLGEAAVGLNTVGMKIATVALLVSSAFQTAWGPFAMSIHQKPEARQVYAGALLLYVWVMSMIATALALFAHDIVRLVAKPEYFGAEAVVGLLSFSFIFIGLKFIAAIGLNIVKDTRPIGLAVTVSGVIFVLLCLVLVPRLGIVGAALASLMSQAQIPLYLFWRAQHEYPIPFRFGRAAAILLIAAAATYAGQVLHPESALGIAARIALLLVVAATGFLLQGRSAAFSLAD